MEKKSLWQADTKVAPRRARIPGTGGSDLETDTEICFSQAAVAACGFRQDNHIADSWDHLQRSSNFFSCGIKTI